MPRIALVFVASVLASIGAAQAQDCTADSASQPAERVPDEGCERATVADPGAGYTPRTEFDNTPYRFNAKKGFTAAEFDAWMKEKGIRIVNGRAVIGGTPQATAVATQQAAPQQAAATTQCQQGAADATC